VVVAGSGVDRRNTGLSGSSGVDDDAVDPEFGARTRVGLPLSLEDEDESDDVDDEEELSARRNVGRELSLEGYDEPDEPEDPEEG
jgi:hypothetical protein